MLYKMMVDKIFDSRVNNPTKFSVFYIEFITLSLVGIVLGVSIDIFFIYILSSLQHYLQEPKEYEFIIMYIISFFQISTGALVLYSLAHVTRRLKWAEQWQDTISGIAFTALFYGVQTNLFLMLHNHSHHHPQLGRS